jgi:hypothetical protein
MVLNANLRLQNISSSTNGNNIINITRNLTGNGSLVTDTYNNVSSGAVAFSNGRIQLQGDKSQWNGDLIVSKGTAQYSGALSYAGNGGITIGAMGDVFGAGLGFNSASSDINLTKAITVSTGGIRLIRNNSGPGSSNNITLGGPIILNGNLTLDQAGLGADKVINVSGDVSGDGGLNVTFDGPHPIANSSVQLSGNNSYTGDTVIGTGAVLVVDTTGSITSSAAIVSGGTMRVRGIAGGVAVNSGTLLVNSGGRVGTTTVAGGTLLVDGIAGSVIVNSGTATVNSGGSISGTTINGSLLTMNGSAGDVVVNTGGTLKGSGGVQGLTLNGGTVDPGNSPGLLTAYELNGSNGRFQFQLGAPTTRGVTYDAINVTNLLTLGANTNFTFEVLDNYNFSNGDSYDLFNFGSIDATGFDITTLDVALPTLSSNELVWDTTSFTTDGLISVVSNIPEPSGLQLFGIGLISLLACHRINKRNG